MVPRLVGMNHMKTGIDIEFNCNMPLNGGGGADGSELDMKVTVLGPDNKGEESSWAEERSMQMAMSSLNIGKWYIDFPNQYLWVCSECKKMIPICREKEIKIEWLLDLVEAGRVDTVISYMLSSIAANSRFDMEIPMVVVRGFPRVWFRVTGAACFNENKRINRIYGIVEDISERKNRENVSLDFLAMATHDLRSPLSVIMLYLQLCERRLSGIDDKFILEILKKAENQAHKMNCLIQHYLDSSSINSGKADSSSEVFEIRELLEEEINDLHLLSPDYIIFLSGHAHVHVFAERQKIGQVIRNLLTNAIKYSPASDVIIVHYTQKDRWLEIAVEDRGAGIIPEERDRVFDKFYRSGHKNETIPGHGIGLYLCKEIVKQYNGDIGVKGNPDRGSIFYFTIPVAG